MINVLGKVTPDAVSQWVRDLALKDKVEMEMSFKFADCLGKISNCQLEHFVELSP